jgi:hypothetical protein
MAGIIQQKINVSLVPNPPSGSVLLQVDTDGLLKYKTDGGTVSLVGGVSFLNIQESSEGLKFSSTPGSLTHSEFINGTQSLLYLGSDGDFLQQNTNGYMFINGTISNFFGTFSFVGEHFNIGSEYYYNGIWDITSIGGFTESSMNYLDSSRGVVNRCIVTQNDVGLATTDLSGLFTINSGINISTFSSYLFWQGPITNYIEVSSSGIINLLTSTTSNPTFRIVDNFTNTRLEIDAQGEFLQINNYGFGFYNSASFSTPFGSIPSAGIALTSSTSYYSIGVTDPTSLGGSTASFIQYLNPSTFEINAVYADMNNSRMRSSYLVGSQSIRFEVLTSSQSAVMYYDDEITTHGIAVDTNDVNIGIKATSSSNFNVSNVNGDNLLDINGEGNLRLRNGQIVGTVSLSAGSATVTNSYVDSNSIIFVTKQNSTSTYSVASVNQSSGQFDIQSTNPSDTDVVGWMLINPIL